MPTRSQVHEIKKRLLDATFKVFTNKTCSTLSTYHFFIGPVTTNLAETENITNREIWVDRLFEIAPQPKPRHIAHILHLSQ